MVRLLDRKTVASLVEGPDLMLRVIEVIEGAIRDLAADDSVRAPTSFPSDLSRPKIFTIMGPAMSSHAIGGAIHLRGGAIGLSEHGSYKLTFDLKSGDLTCIMEDGPVHRYMHGADMGVATRWLARADAETLGVVTSAGSPTDATDPARAAAMRGVNARASTLTMAGAEAVCAVRPIRRIHVYSSTAEHRAEVSERMMTQLGIPAVAVETAEEAVSELDIVTLTTNNALRGTGDCGVRAEWLTPGTHVNSLIREEVDASVVRATKLFPLSLPDLLAIDPPWEPYISVVRAGEVEVPAGLDEVVAKRKPGRTSPDEITMFTGASVGAMHTALAAWVYEMALEQGVGLEWRQEA